MGRGPIYALAITVVVLLVAGAWWLRADGTAPGKVPAAATGDSASAGPAVRRSDRPAPGSPSTHGASTATTLHSTGGAGTATADLPAPAASLAENFDALAARADRGDSRAACRLAWDLYFCRFAAITDSSETDLVDFAAQNYEPKSPGEQEAVEAVVEHQRWRERASTVCAGLSDEQRQQDTQRMYQAARLGHALSMAQFAISPRFDNQLLLEQADTIVGYRDHAAEYLRRAAAAGEPTAFFGLFRAYQRGRIATGAGSIRFPFDPVDAYAVALTFRDLSTGASASEVAAIVDQWEAQLSPDQLRAAQARHTDYRRALGPIKPRDFQTGVFRPNIGSTCLE